MLGKIAKQPGQAIQKTKRKRQFDSTRRIRLGYEAVEIDDVPVVTLAVTGASDNPYSLRRAGEELVERLSVIPKVSRAYVIGGQPRTIRIDLDPIACKLTNWESPMYAVLSICPTRPASQLPLASSIANFMLQCNPTYTRPNDVGELVVGVFDGRPVFLKDVADIVDGPSEVTDYVRHGWGAASTFDKHPSTPVGFSAKSHAGHGSAAEGVTEHADGSEHPLVAIDPSRPAVTIAIANKREPTLFKLPMR